ncbi:hypothetical protein Bca52824_019345 [Brassica carinata]|uniref:Uncharacterized protein n=1 Tax=Brassica carinata TaxID=52824 RepID=A0A8X8AZK7_BRACI|nr:hypothetical protein Bca52824_019345 [Brassica carinata]
MIIEAELQLVMSGSRYAPTPPTPWRRAEIRKLINLEMVLVEYLTMFVGTPTLTDRVNTGISRITEVEVENAAGVIRDTLAQYTACADPTESAARRDRVRIAEAQGTIEKNALQMAKIAETRARNSERRISDGDKGSTRTRSGDWDHNTWPRHLEPICLPLYLECPSRAIGSDRRDLRDNEAAPPERSGGKASNRQKKQHAEGDKPRKAASEQAKTKNIEGSFLALPRPRTILRR